MTEERKKYLASISKEEIYIRREICDLKHSISNNKYALNNSNGIGLKTIYKICIRQNKTLIKALKKQLPAPAKMSCPICRIVRATTYLGFNEFEYDGEYCAYCGQKLR